MLTRSCIHREQIVKFAKPTPKIIDLAVVPNASDIGLELHHKAEAVYLKAEALGFGVPKQASIVKLPGSGSKALLIREAPDNMRSSTLRNHPASRA